MAILSPRCSSSHGRDCPDILGALMWPGQVHAPLTDSQNHLVDIIPKRDVSIPNTGPQTDTAVCRKGSYWQGNGLGLFQG